jgi:hypothetical protein
MANFSCRARTLTEILCLAVHESQRASTLHIHRSVISNGQQCSISKTSTIEQTWRLQVHGLRENTSAGVHRVHLAAPADATARHEGDASEERKWSTPRGGEEGSPRTGETGPAPVPQRGSRPHRLAGRRTAGARRDDDHVLGRMPSGLEERNTAPPPSRCDDLRHRRTADSTRRCGNSTEFFS